MTVGSVARTPSMRSFTSVRLSRRPARRRTISERWVTISVERSTTVCAGELGLDAELDRRPAGVEAEHRLLHVVAREWIEVLADHEHAAGRRDTLPDGDSVGLDDVRAQRELGVVTGADRRHHEAELHGELAAQGRDAVEQIPAAGAVDELDQVEADVELERLDACIVGHLLG